MKIMSQSDLLNEIAKRSRFLKSDVKIIMDSFTEILEDLIRDHEPFTKNERTKLLMKSRGLGKLYLQLIPERTGKKGLHLPKTTRPIFRLSQNIRYANKKMVDSEFEPEESDYE